MLIYEVNIEVDESINYKVAGWLTEHISKMLEYKGFKAAQWFFRLPEDEDRKPDGKTLWSIQYLVENKELLQDYLQNHAQKNHQEAIDQFGDKFSATRRVLNLLSVLGSPYDEPESASSST